MSVDLSKLQHNDQCRYWDDGEFCTCGADTYEELKEVRAKVEQLERSNKELRESLEPPSIEAAHAMGAKGGPVVEAERLAFEAWMRGHCWAIGGEWDGKQYVSRRETGALIDGPAMLTRQLWAAWRDRAALSAADAKGEKNG